MGSLRSTSRRPLVIVGIGLSLVALAIVIRNVDLPRVLTIIAGANAGVLAVALAVVAAQLVVRAARWSVLLPAPRHEPAGHAAGARADRIGVLRIVPVVLVGYLGNAILPARLGEAVRSVLIAQREGLPVTATFGSVLLERLIDTLVLATFGAIAAAAIGLPSWVGQAALVALVISLLAVAALAVAPRLLVRLRGRRLASLVETVRGVVSGARSHSARSLFVAVGLSAIAWLLDATIYWLVASSLGIPIVPLAAVVISAVAVLSTAVPSAPGYVGTFELATVAAAAALGLDPDSGLAIAVVAHGIVVLPLSLGGAVAAAGLGAGWRRPAVVG